MATVYLNGKFEDEKAPLLRFDNRGMQYGDRFFETFLTDEHQVFFGADHLERAKNAAEVLGYKTAKELDEEHFKPIVKKLRSLNKLTGFGRFKLIVYRKEGGKYLPLNNETGVYMECRPAAQHSVYQKGKLALSASVSLPLSVFSPFKIFSLPYVMASKEAERKNASDAVLCDTSGNVAECTMANLFWVENQVIYTPPLSTGCLAGVMRKNFLKLTESVREETITPKSLSERAENLFSMNVSGFFEYSHFEGKKLKPIYEKLKWQLSDVLKQANSHLYL